MQIVIDIPKKTYEELKTHEVINAGEAFSQKLIKYIKKGIPLPKGHGDLIDVDDIRVIELEDSLHIIRHDKGDEIDVYIDAPTVISADKE